MNPSEAELEELRRAMFAVSEPHRFELATLLRDRTRSVSELVEALGWPQPLVSHHLSVLLRVGLVQMSRDGRRRLYRLVDTPGPDLLTLLELLQLTKVSGRFAAPTPSSALIPPGRASNELEDFLL